MLPRINAQEQLNRIEAAALAAGGYEQHDQRRMMDQLRGAMRGETEKRPPMKANQGQLAGMGIGMRLVPVEVPQHG